MKAETQNASERINLRLKRTSKSLIERAASFEGKTLSHFILTSALERAEKTVQEHEHIALTSADARIFYEALAEPVHFNSKLVEALNEHGRRVKSR